ncbi:cupin domain-containing protein [Lophiotrema nucula]|uniref:Cupin domain-containing protein n=1 Tax=Lophiotrema nucula TaxID=690887 RepID=A0A6A5YYD5_9PLEO|nr:cupin domain-containing protein [Lophiotrema nucula]
MSQQTEQLLDNGLRPACRYITTHDSDGRTDFSDAIPQPLRWQQLANGARFSLAYATEEQPVNMTEDKDLGIYAKNLDHLPGVFIPGGTVLRMVDLNPGSTSPMHRTISCDYGVVLEGEVELILDSGEKTLLKRGDITIQRGTNHAWRNTSDTEWARMLYFLQEAQPLSFNGKLLGEDYGGGMDEVKPSKR